MAMQSEQKTKNYINKTFRYGLHFHQINFFISYYIFNNSKNTCVIIV